MDPQARVAFLQTRPAHHRSAWLYRRRPASRGTCCEIRRRPSSEISATNRSKSFLLQRFGDLLDGLVGEVAIGRNIDLADLVVADELAADLAELRPQERFAAGEIEILDPAERSRKSEELLCRQIVTPVEVLPVETVLALLIADRVDEQDQERRAGQIPIILQGNSRMTYRAAKDIHKRTLYDQLLSNPTPKHTSGKSAVCNLYARYLPKRRYHVSLP